MKKLLYHPYQLSFTQRIFLSSYFAVGSFCNPEKGDFIAGLADATGENAAIKMLEKLRRSSSGRILLQNKPTVSSTTLDLVALRKLPMDTLGGAYVKYIDQHGFSPDERTVVRFMVDEEAAYAMTRYRQVHDFWHVLADLPPTILGEIALKAFEFQVTALPMCAMSVTVGQLKLTHSERFQLLHTYIPWASRAAQRCNDDLSLLSYRYEENLHKSIDEVRRDLCFEKAPSIL